MNFDRKYSLVSVIIPTHNRSFLLKRAIQSVLDQTYPKFECIVVDDASKDQTPDVISSFEDDRIKYFLHEKNKGASAARNTGIRNSAGKFIAFLDDDDEWLDTKLEKQVTVLEKLPSKYGMVYCWMDYYDSKEKIIFEHHPTLQGYVFTQVLDAQRLGGCPTLLVRQNVIDEVGGFDESLLRGNDGDFIRRVCRKYEVDFVPEVLVKVHTAYGLGRISDNDKEGLKNAIIGEKAKLKKFGKELFELPKIRAHILLKIANHYSALGQKAKANQLEREAIQLDKKILLKKFYLSFPHFIRPYFRYLFGFGRKLQIALIKLNNRSTLIKQRFLDRFKLNDLEKIYSKEWVEECLDDKWNSDIRNFSEVVFNKFRPASVVDVGCGLGLYLNYYRELGAKKIMGIEGNKNALDKAIISEIVPHDLRKPFRLNQKYELVSCLEVAEHIHKRYSNILVDTLVHLCDNEGNIIFTAAPPGQYGIHHINLQLRDFWIDLFAERNFFYSKELRNFIHAQIKFQHISWIKDNLMVFSHRKNH